MFSIQIEDHRNKLIAALQKAFECSLNVDCILACEGKVIKCHKYLLAAFSDHFDGLINEELSNQNTVVIYVSNMKHSHLSILINSIYYGNFEVPNDQLPELLRSAQSLGFTHLCNTDLWTFRTHNGDKQSDEDGNHSEVRAAAQTSETSADGLQKRATEIRTSSSTAIHDSARALPNRARQENDVASPTASTAASSGTKQASANGASELAAVKKMTPPELLSKANSILNRCLDLISKPVSSSGSESDQKTNQTLADLSKSLQSLTQQTDVKSDAVKCVSPHRRKSDQTGNATLLPGLPSSTHDIPLSPVPPPNESPFVSPHNLSTGSMSMGYRPSSREEGPLSPTWLYQQSLQSMTDKSRPLLEKELQCRRLQNPQAYLTYEQMKQQSQRTGASNPAQTAEMQPLGSQTYVRASAMDVRFSHASYMPAVIAPYPSMRIPQRIDAASSYHRYPTKSVDFIAPQSVLISRDNPAQRYPEAVMQSEAAKLFKSKDPFQELITAKSRGQSQPNARTSSISPIIDTPLSAGSNVSSSKASVSPTSVASDQGRSVTRDSEQLSGLLQDRERGSVTRTEDNRQDYGGSNHALQLTKNGSESNINRQSIHKYDTHPSESSSHQAEERSDELRNSENVEGEFTKCSSPVGAEAESAANHPPFKKRKGSPPVAKSVYPCKECGRVMPSYAFLQEHIRAKHSQLKRDCEKPDSGLEVLDRDKQAEKQ